MDREMSRKQKSFKAVRNTSYDIIMMVCIIIYLSKPIAHTTLRMNPKVNYGHWVVTMCQYRFILVKKKKKKSNR